MRIKKLLKISVSYNAIGKFTEPTEIKLSGGSVLVLPYTFCPSKDPSKKSPEAVTSKDPNFKTIFRHVSDQNLESIDVFIGKIDSGSLEIIHLFLDLLGHLRHKIFWIVCAHEAEEKLLLLEALGISRDSPNVWRFWDNVTPCRDSYPLLGRIYGDLDISA